jgi:membrane-associated protease RseP (regulator of RpoE activity)
MYLALTFLFFFLAIAFHELGHALAMRKYGIKVETLGIGMPMSPKLIFRPAIGEKIFGEGFSLMITPWLIGAFVKPADKDEDYEKKLSYQDAAHINGAGIVANLAFALALLSPMTILIVNDQQPNVLFGGYILSGAFLIVAYLLIRFSRQFCAWFLPPLSVVSLFFFARLLWNAIVVRHDDKALGGIVTASIAITDIVKNLPDAIWSGFAISLSLAIVNVLPFFPLDGGRIAKMIVEHRFPKLSMAFMMTGGVLVILMIIASVSTDIWQAFLLFTS